MKGFEITGVKQFMSALLARDVFDSFCVSEANVQMGFSMQIDGHRNPAFYNESELEQQKDSAFFVWGELRPLFFKAIAGKKAPLYFRIVLRLSTENVARVTERAGTSIRPEDVQGLFINIQYDHELLQVVTGTSLKIFILDKSFEQVWDGYCERFLKKNELF